MKKRSDQIRSLMQVQYDLDQIALTNFNGEIALVEKSIKSSFEASRELQRIALSSGVGLTAIGQQLASQENARSFLKLKKGKLEAARELQRKKSAISFAKWRVSKRLT